MSKPESIYMWDNVYNTIQMIELQIDLINRRTYLYDPQNCSPDNEDCSLKSSHIIGWFVPMKEPDNFCMGLSLNVHPLMNDSLSWKVIFNQDRRISRKHFYHLAMNSYLHQKISPWKITMLCIQWHISISVIMIDVWWHHHGYNKEQWIYIP